MSNFNLHTIYTTIFSYFRQLCNFICKTIKIPPDIAYKISNRFIILRVLQVHGHKYKQTYYINLHDAIKFTCVFISAKYSLNVANTINIKNIKSRTVLNF